MRMLAANTTSAQTEAGDVASVIGTTAHRAKQLTTAPVEPGAIGSPEFCRPADCRRLFGIGRSYVYQLIQSGDVRSVSVRKRGAKTGIRLLDVESVRAFIRGQFTTDANDQR
jgi:hypothetical protein